MKESSNKKLLLLMQLAPPVHGASVINGYLKSSEKINKKFNCQTINIATSEEISDIGFFSFNKVFKTLKVLLATFKVIKQNKPDVVYITLSPAGFGFFKDSLLLIIAKLFKKKILIHIHGRGIKSAVYSNVLLRRYYCYVFKNTYTIVLSNILLSDIPNVLLIKKFFILNNCIKANFSEKEIIKKEISDKIICLLFLSNLVKEKGIYEFLEVCRILKEKKIQFKADVIGKPFDVTKKDIDDYINANKLHDNLCYHGALYGEDKDEILKNSDILIFPTKFSNEAFPLVLLEGFYFGIVPISVNIGGIGDIIKDNQTGFCFDDNKPDCFANTVIHLNNNRDVLHNLSKNCQKEFYKNYTIDIFEDRFTKIITEVILEKN